MMNLLVFCVLVLYLSITTAQQVVEVERDDGSYSTGLDSQSLGGTADSVAALLTKASGWTEATGFQGRQQINIQLPDLLRNGLQIAQQIPYVEILKLIEAFLRFKGEFAGRAWTLISDNAHIIAALRDTLIRALPTIHGFSLNSIIILRKVLEYASSLYSNLNVSVSY